MHRGLTLLECLLVLVVMGVAATMAIPALRGALDKLLVHRATTDLLAFYHAARLNALLSGGLIRLEFSPPTLRAVRESPTDSTVLTVPGPARYGVTLDVSRSVVRIQPSGLGWGAANSMLVLRRGAAAESLAVSRLGRLRRLRP